MGSELFFIAHRGNLGGIDEARANTVAYVQQALASGYHAEVDVFCRDGRFHLGHDRAEAEVDLDFLLQPGIWCHAKDVPTMDALIDVGAHVFFQARDDVALTSHGFLWTHSGCGVVTPRSILTVIGFDAARLEDLGRCAGICSDHVADYRARVESMDRAGAPHG